MTTASSGPVPLVSPSRMGLHVSTLQYFITQIYTCQHVSCHFLAAAIGSPLHPHPGTRPMNALRSNDAGAGQLLRGLGQAETLDRLFSGAGHPASILGIARSSSRARLPGWWFGCSRPERRRWAAIGRNRLTPQTHPCCRQPPSVRHFVIALPVLARRVMTWLDRKAESVVPGPATRPPDPPTICGWSDSYAGLLVWRRAAGFGIRLARPLRRSIQGDLSPRHCKDRSFKNRVGRKAKWGNLGGTWTSGGTRPVLERFLTTHLTKRGRVRWMGTWSSSRKCCKVVLPLTQASRPISLSRFLLSGYSCLNARWRAKLKPDWKEYPGLTVYLLCLDYCSSVQCGHRIRYTLANRSKWPVCGRRSRIRMQGQIPNRTYARFWNPCTLTF